jgi:biotin-dependent carboxylase-like uncharacterized protein
MTPALRVIAPGLMTTVQDLGRPGYQRLGIPVSGALDRMSLCAANAIVGNPAEMGALEIAYQGPTLLVAADSVRVAYAGASTTLDVAHGETATATRGQHFAPLQSVRLRQGQVLRIGGLSGGAVGYLAVEGGFDIAPVLGSQSTYARAGLGGLAGRPLQHGDLLPLRLAQAEEREERMLPALDLGPPPSFRVVLGPQDDHFTDKGKRTLLESVYTVSRASDRMGMRLDGPTLEHGPKGSNIVSDGIAPGSIQVPGNGQPIVLLADRQTTGGYPKIATVISADIPALGRLMPGARVSFQSVTIDDAEAARHQLASRLASFADHTVPVRCIAAIDQTALLGANLVSGMVNAHDINIDDTVLGPPDT